jgi:DNA polymerase I-like protein with 3'-5' exonuclease and polymerase domains
MGKAFRGLIDPPDGYVIVELDYHSEEIGCQAYLSGDKTMAEMYEGPDYYTSIAQRLDPTVKDKHDPKRKKFKVIALMSNYGCGAAHLAEIAKITEKEARDTLKDLKTMFKTYWRYVGKCLDKCGEGSSISFSDGFRIKNAGGKITSLANWPFQGVGALILRKILVKLYQANVRVVAPIHDAISFMCKESEWKSVTETVAQIMRDASKECLGTVVDVGEPEVTYHGIPNCHSELSSREDYAKVPDILGKDQKEYYADFQRMMQGVSTDVEGDSENLYVDEIF